MTLAFVFPGQGSQAVGMQADIVAEFPQVLETYAEARDVLGFDVRELIQSGPEDRLNETVNTQPVMVTAGVAAWRVWEIAGGALPAMMAGHSLGEYSALVCAGSLAFDDALRLVRRRAELMQNAVPAGEGAMAAVLGLEDQAIIEVCERASGTGIVEPVNFNSPGQVVVAGNRAAIEKMMELAKAAGAKRVIMLPVSVPAHSSLMRPVGDALAEALSEVRFSSPKIPVINASNAAAYGGEEDIRGHLTRQVSSPVRWVDVINYFTRRGVTTVAECGPGKVLTALNRRINRDLATTCIDSPEAISSLLAGANG